MMGLSITNGHGQLDDSDLDGFVENWGRKPDVGSLDLLDLQLLNRRQGRDPLPFPFMQTRRSRFDYADEVDAYASTLAERVNGGDLSRFTRCLDALSHADVTVTGHVQYLSGDTPSIRLLAFRAGQAGYLMQQRAGEDVIDVSAVSPFELGASVATAMALAGPGRHESVVNGEIAPARTVTDDDDVVIRNQVHTASGVTVFAKQVSAYARVQSTWQPARTWGMDKDKEFLIWVRVIDDGDYLGAPDRTHGTPLTTAQLGEHIERLIAKDLELLRESRGD